MFQPIIISPWTTETDLPEDPGGLMAINPEWLQEAIEYYRVKDDQQTEKE